MLAHMAVINASRHTCHSPKGLKQTPTMPMREASVAPMHVWELVIISLIWVGFSAREATRCHNSMSSAWTGADSSIWNPWAILSLCSSRVNMLAAPDMEGTVLRRVPSHFCQWQCEHLCAMVGMVFIRGLSFPLQSSGSVRTCWTVSISQPSMNFCML